MKILIPGANGMVARALAAHCRSMGDEVVAMTRQELDIADRDAVFSIVLPGGFDAVINCAAYTDVDGSETHVDLCYAVNAKGVRHLAEASRDSGAVFVTISTDYVFDGANPGFYSETDEARPLGVYGKAKLEGEQSALAVNPDSIVVRTGWIYGEGGTNFLSVMHRLLAEGKHIKAIHDSYGTPTYADDLAVRLRELSVQKASGIFNVTNSGSGTSYAGFAEKVCEIRGYDNGLLQYASADELERPAPRPKNSKLACVRAGEVGLAPLSDWEDALGRFLGEVDGRQKSVDGRQ